jgi:hypothetical protein
MSPEESSTRLSALSQAAQDQGLAAPIFRSTVGTARGLKNLHSRRGFFFPWPDGMRYSRRPQGKMDNIIEARELQIERKHFYVELRENDRGRFLRITEEAHGRRNSIIVPSTGVDEFTATISEVLTNGETAPA